MAHKFTLSELTEFVKTDFYHKHFRQVETFNDITHHTTGYVSVNTRTDTVEMFNIDYNRSRFILVEDTYESLFKDCQSLKTDIQELSGIVQNEGMEVTEADLQHHIELYKRTVDRLHEWAIDVLKFYGVGKKGAFKDFSSDLKVKENPPIKRKR